MIKSVRIHHTSDGGTLDIGVSDKSLIEVNGVRLSLAKLIELVQNAGAVVELGSLAGIVSFTPHRCPEPEVVPAPTPKPARKTAKETPEE